MQPYPLTVLQGGINRLRVKGAARANMLYDLLNGYITNAGSVSIREGTFLAETLNSNTAGLMSMDGSFNVFSTSFVEVPEGYIDNVLYNANDPSSSIVKIWFAKPFLGFPFVVAQFSDGSIVSFWLQNGGGANNGVWEPSTVYLTGSIVTPDTPNGLAYQAVRDMPQNPLWVANTEVTLGEMVEPTEYTGFAYRAIAVSAAPGTEPFTSATEPAWPSVAGATIQEFGDFDLSSTATSSSTSSNQIPLGNNITDKYGDSAEIAGAAGVPTTLATPTASNSVTNWAPGTLYAPGAVVRPSTTQGAFINAIPNGDFEDGDDGNWNLGANLIITDTPAVSYQGNYCLEAELNRQTTQATMTDYGVVTPGQSVTATCYANPNNNGTALTIWIILNWYDASDVFISSTPASESPGQSNSAEGFGYRKISITGNAPATAAHCRVSIVFATGTVPNTAYVDLVAWSLEEPAAVSQFLYEAVQQTAGTSAATQPTWPTTAGDTVVDGGVTWEAIGTSIVTWQAVPIMMSGGTAVIETLHDLVGGTGYVTGTYNNVPTTGGTGTGATLDVTVNGSGVVSAVAVVSGGTNYVAGDVLTVANTYLGGSGSGFSTTVDTVTGGSGEPTFPTTVGNTVSDPSNYTTADGFSNDTTMSWEAISRAVTDTNIPNNKAAALGASHIFEGNDDIVDFSAAVNPTDWTSSDNAGYLPTGTNNYGDNPVQVLALYRSNLVVFNAGGYQMWQIDPDPANMALLDAEPVGSTWTLAAQSVANDLLFLAEVGVRNLGTSGAQANMQIGNTGQPIDPLVLAQIEAGVYTNIDVISLYYPARGQYWLFFGPQAFVLTINGAGIRSWSRYTFPDTITDWTLNGGILYLRTAGNLILEVSAETPLDEAQQITASIAGDVMTVTSGSGLEPGLLVAGAEPGTSIVGPIAVPLVFTASNPLVVPAAPSIEAAVAAATGTILAVNVDTSTNAIYICRSTDGGATWDTITTSMSWSGVTQLVWGGGTTWFLGSTVFYYSTDDGLTWTRIFSNTFSRQPIGSAYDGVSTVVFLPANTGAGGQCMSNYQTTTVPADAGWALSNLPSEWTLGGPGYGTLIWDGTQFVALATVTGGDFAVYTAPSGFGAGGPVWTQVVAPVSITVIRPDSGANGCLAYTPGLGYSVNTISGTNGVGVVTTPILANLFATAATLPAFTPSASELNGVWGTNDRIITGAHSNDLPFGTTVNAAESFTGATWAIDATQFTGEVDGDAEELVMAVYDHTTENTIIFGALGSVSIAPPGTGPGTYQITPPQTFAAGTLTIGVGITGVVQWPYLELGAIGMNNQLIGVDLIGDGEVVLQVAYRQSDPTTFSDNAGFATSKNVTKPYTISMIDTLDGNPIPLPLEAPSLSLCLTFPPGQFWDWQAANFYLNKNRGRGF